MKYVVTFPRVPRCGVVFLRSSLSLDSGSEHFQQGLCCQGFATTAQVDNPVASRTFEQHPAFQWGDTGEARQLESVILHDLQSWGPV